MLTLEDFVAKYPYTNFHELNQDWILATIKWLINEVTNFVSLNAIKYADPIQWDITRQYEKNTVVVDPMSGTAYLSVAAVPIGAQLNRPEYWTVIFDLGSFIVKAGKNFANTYEDTATTTATVNTPAGGWIMWGETLYVANVNITAGDAYVPDANITQITVEDAFQMLQMFIGDLNDLNTSDKSSIVNAINEVLVSSQAIFNIVANTVETAGTTTATANTTAGGWIMIGDELYTADVNITIGDTYTPGTNITQVTIEDCVSAISALIGALSSLTTTDKSSVVNAINELNSNIGDLSTLATSDKSSAVNAINEVAAALQANAYVTPEMFGAVGDGSTDDTAAFQAALDTHKLILLQSGTTYAVSNLTVDYGRMVGGNESVLRMHGSITHTDASGVLYLEHIRFIGDNTNNALSGRMTNLKLYDCIFYNFDTVINETGNSYVGYIVAHNCIFRYCVHVFYSTVSANYITFRECVFNSLTDIAIIAPLFKALLLDHCDIEDCVGILGSSNPNNCSLEGVTFNQCYFETNTILNNDTAMAGGPGMFLGTLNFFGGYWNNTTATMVKFDRTAGYNLFVFFKGVNFQQIADSAIVLSDRCWGEAEMAGNFTNLNKITGMNNSHYSVTLGGIKQN